MNTRSLHWQKVYEKNETEFSWYQSYPDTSVKLIREAGIARDEAIIDVGGGDSHLADALLDLGFTNISVLDISSRAIDRARQRLGGRSKFVKWIVSDVIDFNPREQFAVWHDRATFHFLTDDSTVEGYRFIVASAVKPAGTFILGAFSEKGPTKCSGLPVRQYNEPGMANLFEGPFRKEHCFEETHRTPFNTEQLFQFCRFTRQ